MKNLNNKNATKHGLSQTKLYHIREGMLARCNKNYPSYDIYGGRGIRVCEEWKDAKLFIKWATNTGYRVGLQIDRIDNDGDYEPSNCRWVTPKENSNNKRNNRILTLNGLVMTVAQWSEKLDIPFNVIHKRLSRGWMTERALGTYEGRKQP